MTADAARKRMHPFHIVIVTVGLPLLLVAGVLLVLAEYGWSGAYIHWLPTARLAFAVLAIGVPAITAVGSIRIAREAGKRAGRSPVDTLPPEIRAQLESVQRNPPPPPPPLSPTERELLMSSDPEALTEQQRNRFILAPMAGLTTREKRRLRGVLTSGDDYREIGTLMRRRRVPSTPPNPTVVALRPFGFLLLALLFTVLPVAIFFADAMIILFALGTIGTREEVSLGWGTLVVPPVLGWFVTLLGPALVGSALNNWTCFVRSLQPRFSQSHIAIIERRSIVPIHRTRVTAVWWFLESVGWLPPLPLLAGAVINGFGLLALTVGWVLPPGLLLAAGIVLVVIGVRQRWRRWKPTFDVLPGDLREPQRK